MIKAQQVVLLHGLSRTARVMKKMADHLESEGYQVLNLDYPSTRYTIENLVDQIGAQIQKWRTGATLHFVVSSMGCLITHFYIKKYAPENLGRVVALGPPYHGSAIIDHLGKYRWFRKFYGPGALELTSQRQGICHRLGPIDYQLGVIAGDRWFFLDWYFARYWLAYPNDGKVAVASTQIEGCRDHIVLPVNHVFLPEYPIVIRQAAKFLSAGHFLRDGG
jgi:hypothetical protein